MIGIWIAILSGTLMSIQGVWNTQVTKQSSLWVSTGMGAADGVSGLCGSMVFYRKRFGWNTVAG
jgi:transporter family-2 protein